MLRMSKKRKEEWAFFLNDGDASPITPFAAGASTTANKVFVLR